MEIVENTQMALLSEPLEVRAEREKKLRESDEWDERSNVEKAFDFLVAARMSHYKPMVAPAYRGDIICLSCGTLYRPDDIMDGENMLLCASCIAGRKGR